MNTEWSHLAHKPIYISNEPFLTHTPPNTPSLLHRCQLTYNANTTTRFRLCMEYRRVCVCNTQYER